MRKKKHLLTELSRRERQMMEIVYEHGAATAVQTQQELERIAKLVKVAREKRAK